jgi:hypothetical protein
MEVPNCEGFLEVPIFLCCTDIVERCCFAWKNLVDQPWHIMPIRLRQWARQF